MDMKFQFGEIKFWSWLHMNNEKQYILHSISLSTQKEKVIIQQTPRLWNKLCHSQTATQKHVLTASLEHRCLPVISSLTYFMNYKLCTWKRLFCYQYSSDTLFTNLKGSIVPPLPECDLKCQISFLLTTPDQSHHKEGGLLHKVSPGPVRAVCLLKDPERGTQARTRNACLCQKEVQDKNMRTSLAPKMFCAASQESQEGRHRGTWREIVFNLEGRSLLVGFCNAKKMLYVASSINQSLRFKKLKTQTIMF